MENMTIILYLCAMVPMITALFVVPDKSSRLFLGYMLLGITVCLIVSEINAQLLGLFGGRIAYVSNNITPIVEEILKAIPVLYFSVLFSDKRDLLISISYAMGIGFALLENMVILTGSIAKVTVFWALMRGFGAARMHSTCTALVGRGIVYVHKRRKLFYCGTLSLLIVAIIIHALFNTLIQSQYKRAAYFAIFAMYIPQLSLPWRRIFRMKKTAKA